MEGRDTPKLWDSDFFGGGVVLAWGWIWFIVGGSRLADREQSVGILMKFTSKLPVVGAVSNFLENHLGHWLDLPETQ